MTILDDFTPARPIPGTTYICHLSGGVASWLAARRIRERHGKRNMILLFADTLYEEASTYSFIDDCVHDLGTRFIRLCDGRTPWQVFADSRFLGNSRVDPCSRFLKRELQDAWVRSKFCPENCVQVFGFDWTEGHRLEKLRKRFSPWPVEAPLLDPPYLEKAQIIEEAKRAGLRVPLLYSLGFSHNNCGGKCVKAGQAHYAKLLQVLPAEYAEAEREEDKLRAMLGDVSILKDRRGGTTKPLSLRAFRQRVQCKDFDESDWGSCSCFVESEGE